MSLSKIKNLEISKIDEDILHVHQIKPPFFFSCCDGLLILPKKGRNKNTVALDLNIEPQYIESLNNMYGPVSNYVCTHGHIDHTSYVYYWEELGTAIHAPNPEANYLLDLHNFYEGFGFNEVLDYNVVETFAKLNGFQNCKQVKSFDPGESLEFEKFKINTISFSGHSKGHIGFLLPSEQILHISCLGFDQLKPEIEGFGPWYGFKQCSIAQYMEDINKAESIFLKSAKILTSSHSYVVNNPDTLPFEYMRKKIRNNQKKVNKAVKSLNLSNKTENELVNQLLKMDIFFPKKRMKGIMLEIYRFWESWIIRKHIQQSENFKK